MEHRATFKGSRRYAARRIQATQRPAVKRSNLDGFIRTIPLDEYRRVVYRPVPIERDPEPTSINPAQPQPTPAPATSTLSEKQLAAPIEPVNLPGKLVSIRLHNELMHRGLVTAAVVISVIGIGASWHTIHTNNIVAAQVLSSSGESAYTATGDNPSEAAPSKDAYANHKVAPDLPRYLRIRTIDVDARVKPLATKDNNQLQAPDNIFDAGWYIGSAQPGKDGATLIDGHMHGRTQPGIFKNLGSLKQNDIIEIERGDGSVLRYAVVSKRTYKAAQTDMQAAMRPVAEGVPGLNIITCAGKFNAAANTYEDRLIVFASLLE